MTLKGSYIEKMTDEDFSSLCEENHGYKIERLPNRHLAISLKIPVFDGSLASSVIDQLQRWSKAAQMGSCVTGKGFLLPNGAIRQATFAWASSTKLISAVLTDRGLRQFCPDFVLEFRQPQDDLKSTKAKMKEWIENGCMLAWLIDEKRQVVYIFEKAKMRMHTNFNKKLEAGPVLPGMVLNLSRSALP
ncbi:MAG TPA: Uma2 family endonuclease [Chryseosolibacter sp.]